TIYFEQGDRIVVELGYRARNSTTSSRTGWVYFGGTDSPDMAQGATDMDRPGWIDLQISGGVEFTTEPTETRRFYLTSVGTPAEVTSTAGIWDDWTDDVYALGDQPEGDSVPVTIAETDPDSGWLGLVGT